MLTGYFVKEAWSKLKCLCTCVLVPMYSVQMEIATLQHFLFRLALVSHFEGKRAWPVNVVAVFMVRVAACLRIHMCSYPKCIVNGFVSAGSAAVYSA